MCVAVAGDRHRRACPAGYVLEPDLTVQRIDGQLLLDDAKSEDSDSVLPIPEVTWLCHREAYNAERVKLGEG